MNGGALFWIIIFALATTCFFVVAAIVAVKGSYDLKDLLNDPDKDHLNQNTKLIISNGITTKESHDAR
jgi:hypothetical protein